MSEAEIFELLGRVWVATWIIGLGIILHALATGEH
jgi:hypothetical protein